MARRRSRGEGTIRQRADGRWEARLRREGETAKVYYGRTKEEAVRKLKGGQKLQADNRPIPREDITVEQFLKEWLEGAKDRGNKRYQTRIWYWKYVHNHVIPGLGKIRLAHLKTADVQAWVDSLSGGKAPWLDGKPASANLCRAAVRVLSSALGSAEKRALVTYNAGAMRLLELPDRGDEEGKEMVPLTTEQAADFMAGIHDDEREALYLLSLALGVRQGEALGLCWPDVHLDDATPWAYIHQELVWVKEPGDKKGHYELQALKTDKSRRQLPLPGFLADALRIHQSRQDLLSRQSESSTSKKKRWGNTWNLVFTMDDGRPLYGPTITHVFQGHLERLGIPKKRYYDLRHSAASFLAARGVPVFDIARFLGHSSTTLVNQVYGHWLDEGRKRVAQEMEAALRTAR